jgi:hypothetical protein
MVHSCWRRAAALLVPAVVAGTVVAGTAGCSSGSPRHPAVTPPPSASRPGKAAPFSTIRLRGALLSRVNGVAAATPAVVGAYATLPEASAGSKPRRGVTVTPKSCAGATLTGFNADALAGSPAAAVTFRVARNAVSEVIVASSGPAAANALAGQFSRRCSSYREKIDGRTFRYSVHESAIKGIGRQARVLHVTTTGAVKNNQWSLIYQGPGFVGSVTVVGPNASELAVRQLARQAYAYAARYLS